MKRKHPRFWGQAANELKCEIANMPVRPDPLEIGRMLSDISKRLRESSEFPEQDSDNPPTIKTSDDHKQE